MHGPVDIYAHFDLVYIYLPCFPFPYPLSLALNPPMPLSLAIQIKLLVNVASCKKTFKIARSLEVQPDSPSSYYVIYST